MPNSPQNTYQYTAKTSHHTADNNAQGKPTKPIEPTKESLALVQAIELAELIMDDSQPWRVHNCKLLRSECSDEGTLPFIYHYDKLAEHLKHDYPLDGSLLANFNKKMTAQQVCELIGVPVASIASPKFVKITGTIVIFHEPLQLAVRLHWTNTSKSADEIYGETDAEAIKLSMKKWLFIGRVDTLSKQKKPTLAVYDNEFQQTDNDQYVLSSGSTYEPMPHNFAINLLERLNNTQDKLDWIDKAIQERVV